MGGWGGVVCELLLLLTDIIPTVRPLLRVGGWGRVLVKEGGEEKRKKKRKRKRIPFYLVTMDGSARQSVALPNPVGIFVVKKMSDRFVPAKQRSVKKGARASNY